MAKKKSSKKIPIKKSALKSASKGTPKILKKIEESETEKIAAVKKARKKLNDYFKKPIFLKKAHDFLMSNRWVRGGILALILAALGAGLATLAFQLWKPPTLAKLLPAEQTVGFIEFECPDLASCLADIKEIPFQIPQVVQNGAPDWMGRLTGMAWVNLSDDSLAHIYFFDVNDKAAAQADLDRFMEVEGLNAELIKGYLVVAPEMESLDLINQVISEPEKSFYQTENFLKMRPNLPYHTRGFASFESAYLWDEGVFDRLNEELPGLTNELALIDPLIEWFPLTGISFSDHDNGLILQTYTVGDKSLMEGDALFHLDKKYQGNLVEFMPDTIDTFWGGQNLSSGISQLMELLNAVDGSSGLVLDTLFQLRFEDRLGDTLNREKTIDQLLEGEYAIGLTEHETCLLDEAALDEGSVEELEEMSGETVSCETSTSTILLLELDDEQVPLVEQITAEFVNRGLIQINFEDSRIERTGLEKTEETYGDLIFHIVQEREGNSLFQYIVYENTLILTTTKDETKAVLDTLSESDGRFTNTEKYQFLSEVMPSADHVVMRTDSDGRITASGMNLFDDGISTLHLISDL